MSDAGRTSNPWRRSSGRSACDFRMQQAHRAAERGELEAGHRLLGDRGAAEHLAAFEHQRTQPGAREIGAAGQAVVAAADDDRVVTFGQANPRWHAPDGMQKWRGCGRRLACRPRNHWAQNLRQPTMRACRGAWMASFDWRDRLAGLFVRALSLHSI